MSQPNPTLYTWVNEICGNLQGEGGLPDRFECWYAGDDGHERLNTLRLNDRREDPVDFAQAITTDIWKICEQHAATMNAGAMSRYAIQVFRNEHDKLPEATHHVLLTGQAQNMLAIGSSISAERGQLIRHNEALHGFAMSLMQGVSGRLARDLEDERSARRRAEQQVVDVSQMREELLDRKHEREMEALKEARSSQRLDQILQTLAALAPAVLSRLGNNKPSDEASRAMLRDRAVSTLMNRLGVEDIQRIAMGLSPELQPAFLELLSSYADDARPAQASDPRAASVPAQSQHTNGNGAKS